MYPGDRESILMLPRAAPLPTRTRGRKITRRILVDTTARRTAPRLLLHAKKPDMQRARQPAGHERGHNARKEDIRDASC